MFEMNPTQNRIFDSTDSKVLFSPENTFEQTIRWKSAPTTTFVGKIIYF